MSWIDRIQNGISITCGDGKVYTPNWLNASKQLEWNVSEFNFPGLDGTLVKKSKKLGTKYTLEFYFQGEFHLDQSAEFEASANDSRPWIIAHPFYGSLTVQAPAFTVDNTGLNVSKWTGTVIETLVDGGIKTSVDAVDAIAIQKNLLDETFAQALLAKPSPLDATATKLKLNKSFNLTVPIIKIPEEVQKYFDLFNKANAAVNTLTASPLLAMRTAIAMLSAPAQFALSVTQRVNLLTDTFNTFRQDLTSLFSPASKQIYQNTAGSIISSICLASSLPQEGDFSNNDRVFQVVNNIVTVYNQYIADLDLIQTLNGGKTTSFIPSPDSLIGLNTLINTTIANLFSIALSSRSERNIITETDTNIIILTHRFYGLDAADNNINEMIENNGFGLDHLLQIKKGTRIKYYI